MHTTIDVRLTVSIDDDKTRPLATLAEFITDQNIESVPLEGLVESLNAGRAEAPCGEKHAHGNGENASNAAAPISAQSLQPSVTTSSASTILTILLPTTTNLATSGLSKIFLASVHEVR